MTKLAIFNPPAGEDRITKPETIVYLRLKHDEISGRVTLKATDKQGRITGPGNLMTIYPNGQFALIPAGKINGQRFEEKLL